MVVYWLVFFLCSYLALVESDLRTRPYLKNSRFDLVLKLNLFILMGIFIGLREGIGADWGTYLNIYNAQAFSSYSLIDLLSYQDPGYAIISELSIFFELGIYGVNVFSGLIVVLGLCSLVRRRGTIWIAMVVAIPYLITVVAMGYVRQAIAFGFVCFAVTALFEKKSILLSMGWVLIAGSFHKTALLFVLIIGFGLPSLSIGVIITALFLISALLGITVHEEIERSYRAYFSESFVSSGTLPRLVLNCIPAVLALFYLKSFNFDQVQKRVVCILSLIVFGLFFAYVYLGPMTLIDRLNIYFMILQVFIISQLPEVLDKNFGIESRVSVLAVILFYSCQYHIWLSHSTHKFAWVPYKNLLF